MPYFNYLCIFDTGIHLNWFKTYLYLNLQKFIILGEIKYDDKLTDEDGVYIQAALLFTSVSGQRRLRVINLALNCGTSMADMYRNCKYDSFHQLSAMKCLEEVLGQIWPVKLIEFLFVFRWIGYNR